LRATPADSRKLTCRDQAVLVLRWFRDRTRTEQLGRDHGVSRATACRYVAEAVDVLSQQAPGQAEALDRALAEGVPYVILDGKVFASDRCSEPVTSVKGEQIDAWYSGKAHRHGGNVQAVMRPDGLPLWAGPAEPGSVNDMTAARWHALPALYRGAALGMPCLADTGYQGAGIGVLVPVKNPQGNQELDIDARARNALLRDLRCRGERGFALLTQRWAALQHVTASPSRITEITRAALVLTQFEHKYIR
jgi:DDE superfamily endonuclease/Helix-turn-helix of DDE superfamily endonuclease